MFTSKSFHFYNLFQLETFDILIIVCYSLIETIKYNNELKRNNINGPISPGIIQSIQVYLNGIPKYDQALIKSYGKIVKSTFGGLPLILTTDPKFIKSVMIKDFSHFVNRRVIIV